MTSAYSLRESPSGNSSFISCPKVFFEANGFLISCATPAASSLDDAISGMAAWNDRKRRMFKPEHIRVAWDRLETEKWTAANA